MNRAVRCALHGSFMYTMLMNNKVWQSVGMIDPYSADTFTVTHLVHVYYDVTVGDEDFTLDIVQSRIPSMYFGLASNRLGDPIATAVSGTAKRVRAMLVRKLRKHVELTA